MKKTSQKTLGILGGGQLAKMLIDKAKDMGVKTAVLDKDKSCPAAKTADIFIEGSLYDERKIRELCKKSDIITYEIEHINTDALMRLEKEKNVFFPYPKTLKIIQDKYLQKKTLRSHRIPTSAFKPIKILNLKKIKFKKPFVQKLRTGGYDGNGVFIVKKKEDLKNLLLKDCIAEELVPIKKELSVTAVRNLKGEMKIYPCVETVFKKEGNLLDYLFYPADIKETIQLEAEKIAVKTMKAFDAIGVFTIEMFLDKKNKIFVNEIAPRPHNCAHHTIEAAEASQFEQHIRAVLNMPLKNCSMISPCAMANILGEKNSFGKAHLSQKKSALSEKNLYVHWYGKKEVRPRRKMGHITVLADTRKKAVEKILRIKKTIKAVSKK